MPVEYLQMIPFTSHETAVVIGAQRITKWLRSSFQKLFTILTILDAAAFKSNTFGTDFVFAYINNDYVDSLQLTIIVSNANNQPTNVSVTSIFPSFETTNVIIQPNTIERVSVDEHFANIRLHRRHTLLDIRYSYGDTGSIWWTDNWWIANACERE